jgi:phage shock protein A
MTTLLGKGRTALLALSHDLMDKVIDRTSPSAVKQLIRDYEVNLAQVEDSLSEARGTKTGELRERDRLIAENARLDARIDALLSDNDPSNDHHAKTLQARYNGHKISIQARQESIESIEEAIASIDEVLSNLRAKHETMLHVLRQLEGKEVTTRAKERAASALQSASSMDLGGMDRSVDDITSRLEHREDVADARLNSARERFDSLTDKDSQLSEIEADLAARRARLASTKEAQPAV